MYYVRITSCELITHSTPREQASVPARGIWKWKRVVGGEGREEGQNRGQDPYQNPRRETSQKTGETDSWS